MMTPEQKATLLKKPEDMTRDELIASFKLLRAAYLEVCDLVTKR